MLEQTGPRATLKRLRRDWPDLRYALEKLPHVARKLVDEALAPVGPPAPVPGPPPHRERARYFALAGGSLVIAASIWIGMDTPPDWVGWLAGAVGLGTLGLGWPRPGQ